MIYPGNIHCMRYDSQPASPKRESLQLFAWPSQDPPDGASIFQVDVFQYPLAFFQFSLHSSCSFNVLLKCYWANFSNLSSKRRYTKCCFLSFWLFIRQKSLHNFLNYSYSIPYHNLVFARKEAFMYFGNPWSSFDDLVFRIYLLRFELQLQINDVQHVQASGWHQVSPSPGLFHP